MAVGIMKRFSLIAHRDFQDIIVSEIRKLGITEIEFKQEIEYSESIADIELKLSKLEFLIDTFSKYSMDKSVQRKVVISEREIKDVLAKFDVESVYNECTQLTKKISNLKVHIAKNKDAIARLVSWNKLPYRLDEFVDTNKLCFIFGSIKVKMLAAMEEKIQTDLYDIVWLGKERSLAYFVLVADREFGKEIEEKMKSCEVQIHSLHDIVGEKLWQNKPCGIIEILESEINDADKNIQEISKEINTLGADMNKALVMSDYLREILAMKIAQSKAERTSETFVLEGWVALKNEEMFKKKIGMVSDAVEIVTRKPYADEKPPTVLQNRRLISPFEFITTLFSHPDYGEFDPTPLFTPFFVVFFALCMSDVVYGILLSAAAYAGLKKISKGNKIFRVLFYCGILTCIAGVLTDSFAGFKLSGVLPVVRNLTVVDIIHEPMKMLFISFALGFVQVVFGMVVKLAMAVKRRNAWGIAGQTLWIGFFVSVVPLVYKLMFGKELLSGINGIVSRSSIIFAAGVVFTHGRNTKHIFLRPLLGLTKLYNIVGNCADILSYSRILALGLAGVAIAQTINMIVKMVFDIPVVGYVLGILIFIGGHAFNLVVNSLGSFVHSMRLQYLEFFSKFFEGNGRVFMPFREERKYSVIEN